MPREGRGAGPICFGTGGWRGILAEDFTLDRARIAVRAVAAWLAEEGKRGAVLVGHDRRFLGPRLTSMAVDALRAAGRRAVPAASVVPTPVLARSVRTRGAAAGIVFTASHNPPEYQGLKVFGSDGATPPREALARIEALAARIASGHGPRLRTRRAPARAPLDLVRGYRADWGRVIRRGALRRHGHRVIYDAMHGAGAGVLEPALRAAGAQVEGLRLTSDPCFGGAAPDPVGAGLAMLRKAVRAARGRAIGLATDGDADRLAVVDESGRALSDGELLALLVDHCARSGRARRGVVLAEATSSLVERVAHLHALPVRRRPPGFHRLSADLLAGKADLAGDETGGFALASFGADKDGMLAAGLVAELAAQEPEGLRGRLRQLAQEVGMVVWVRGSCARTARAATRLATLRSSAPLRVAGARVCDVGGRGAVRLRLDDGFVLLRASSTEPVIRVCAEGPSEAVARARLRATLALVAG